MKPNSKIKSMRTNYNVLTGARAKIMSTPSNKKCISIHVVRLDYGVIVLEYDFHETSVCTIDYRSSNLRCALNWPGGKIQRVHSLLIILVSKLQRCIRRRIWNSVKSSPALSINDYWWHIPQLIHLGHIDWTIMKRSLRVWTCSTSANICPDK